jgi:hypothetical protein
MISVQEEFNRLTETFYMEIYINLCTQVLIETSSLFFQFSVSKYLMFLVAI